jgi:hypothetical protein
LAHDVFISYSTKDKTIADAVCAKLEENKIRAWIAPRDVPPGSNFAASIIQAINTCRVFVLIWSADTNTSKHILNEINQAFDRGIIIIPFRIQDVQPTDEMRYYFGRTHWLDAIDPPLENHIATLKDTILINLGRAPQPPTPTTLPESAPRETVEPPAELSPVKKPAIVKAEAVNPPLISPPPRKSQKIDKEPPRAAALPPKFTRFIPFAAGGLAVLTLVVLLVSGVFKGSPPEGTEEGSPPAGIAQASPSPITPTRTVRLTATSTPIPAWVDEANAFAEPILAAIMSQPPAFEDDFSQVDPAWIIPDYPSGDERVECINAGAANMNITDGSMKFSMINCELSNLLYKDLQYANYALQFDINFHQTPLEFLLRMWGQSALEEVVELNYSLQSPTGDWIFAAIESGNLIEKIHGNANLDFAEPVTITIIHQSPTIVVFMNSSVQTLHNTREKYAGPFALDSVITSWEVIPTETLTLELDNFRIWDLDKLEY